MVWCDVAGYLVSGISDSSYVAFYFLCHHPDSFCLFADISCGFKDSVLLLVQGVEFALDGVTPAGKFFFYLILCCLPVCKGELDNCALVAVRCLLCEFG